MNWIFSRIEIIRLIVTCFSIVVTSTITGMSVYLLYKARTSPYGEAIYSKQLEGCVELANAITEAVIRGFGFLVAGGSKTKKGKVLYSQTRGKLTNIYVKYSKWAILLPREISLSVINFTNEIERILNLPFKKEENSKLIGKASIKILDEISDAIGTEPLSKETLKLIKKIKS